MAIITHHLQHVLNALPTDNSTNQVLNEKVQKSNIVAYSCLGLHAIAPLLSNPARGWDQSTFGIIPQQASDWDED
ncbi:hypothetical protein BDR06DRAFT_960464 [Suillus hirtellus]|nr:hypothetical protein BDR06DRAFT_960464 [Suillus hirtellus]